MKRWHMALVRVSDTDRRGSQAESPVSGGIRLVLYGGQFLHAHHGKSLFHADSTFGIGCALR